ncbi:transposase [Terrilactibacillus sp. BCM23-1]|uniref:Transposase n=1 Tax=Terrilactibacillus tamarindi TaxID=2599694 RepID=A0A6N8CRU0_9BACI|nr:transposase [Terrilactibacillus tamarindi]MTT32358.1 transposase [Terrilactibacillus tamarindi]
MARKKRIWFPGAKYHITSRGIRKMPLFYDEEDREEYLRLLEETKYRIPFYLHAYCLMTNHIHLQIETLDHPTGHIIKHLHFKYAKYFNKKYDYTGHVFESRYGAELIDSIDYELDVNKYIHLNPVRAKMVFDLSDYPWSSYGFYIGSKSGSMVTTDRILSFFPEPKVENYIKFILGCQVPSGKDLCP